MADVAQAFGVGWLPLAPAAHWSGAFFFAVQFKDCVAMK
jgi:hypothetical protein